MTTAILSVLAVFGVVLVWGVVNPRSLWRKADRRFSRNPGTTEPSDAGYMLSRVQAGVGLALLIPVMVGVWWYL